MLATCRSGIFKGIAECVDYIREDTKLKKKAITVKCWLSEYSYKSLETCSESIWITLIISFFSQKCFVSLIFSCFLTEFKTVIFIFD